MTGTSQTPRRISWRERLFVLGGPAVAALCTAASSVLGTGAWFVGFTWIAAIAWTVLASLAAALWRGFRHRDWSAFRGSPTTSSTRRLAATTDLHDDGHLR